MISVDPLPFKTRPRGVIILIPPARLIQPPLPGITWRHHPGSHDGRGQKHPDSMHNNPPDGSFSDAFIIPFFACEIFSFLLPFIYGFRGKLRKIYRIASVQITYRIIFSVSHTGSFSAYTYRIIFSISLAHFLPVGYTAIDCLKDYLTIEAGFTV